MSEERQEYQCPFCDRKSEKPGCIRFHVKLIHPEKLDEFDSKYSEEIAHTNL